jgi:hypothetical protein
MISRLKGVNERDQILSQLLSPIQSNQLIDECTDLPGTHGDQIRDCDWPIAPHSPAFGMNLDAFQDHRDIVHPPSQILL